MEQYKAKIDFGGFEYSLETGKYAKFANASVMVRCGDSMVLVTVTAANEPKDISFLPLQVEYKEKYAAGGKIPGGFLKREGRPLDHEVVSARLIDRPIRPMLPKSWRFETQIITTVHSFDPLVNPDTLAAVGASAALMISDVPFNGPISEVRIGRIDGEFVVNPNEEALESSDIDMTVAGTDTAITMVEGESKEISEQDFLDALEFAHERVKELNQLQKDLYNQFHLEKRVIEEKEIPEEIIATVAEAISDEVNKYVHSFSSKKERSIYRNEIQDKAIETVQAKFADSETYEEAELIKLTKEVVGKIEKSIMRTMILDEKIRLDGRKLDEIRPIECEVDVLPRTHGSALFTRGETQSLTSLTLGTSRDEQMIDGMTPLYKERFMLHYNFPPFCVGEVGRLMVSRREVGHGHLAWRAVKAFLPSKEDFPYTIRLVSDILESNGSSSMATVCASSLALQAGGVPMKNQVAGIAMGLVKEDDKVSVLSDILGDEDFLGDMDFKVAGSKDGITAFQMDIKIEGLSIEIMRSALEQAHAGRLHILGIMDKLIDTPREVVSQYAPRFYSMKVPVDTIGAIIGSGGETIRGLTAEYECEINIEDDGTVMVAAVDGEKADAVRAVIEQLIKKPEAGEIYQATVKDVREGLGAIVEFMPGNKGLLHISQIAWEKVENVEDIYKVGDEVEVKLIEVQRDGKFRLSRKILLPKPEDMTDEKFEEMKAAALRPPRPSGNRYNNNRRPQRR